MRIHFEDHAGFQRAALHVTVACSALAAVAALAGSEQLRPGVAVLGAAIATLALALGHLQLVLDPVVDALVCAATGADAGDRRLLTRAADARARIARALGSAGGRGAGEGRALADAANKATVALAELARRRQSLARTLAHATDADAGDALAALESKRDAAEDAVVRETYARAARTSRERASRAAALSCVLARIDARLHAAVTELEGAALVSAARAELAPAEPPAALAATCDRLRSASAELGAECEAYTEIAAF
jgi:hypothetical protein